MIRKIFHLFAVILLISISSSAWTAGNIFVSKTIAIEAPANAVWAKVRDFNALNTWHPAVANSDIIEGENNMPGAKRLLTLHDGGTIYEELQSWDEDTMTFSYKIYESVLPVSSYEATLKVEPISDNSTKVIWSASFNAGKGADDDTARDTISGIFDAGLENLTKILSGK